MSVLDKIPILQSLTRPMKHFRGQTSQRAGKHITPIYDMTRSSQGLMETFNVGGSHVTHGQRSIRGMLASVLKNRPMLGKMMGHLGIGPERVGVTPFSPATYTADNYAGTIGITHY